MIESEVCLQTDLVRQLVLTLIHLLLMSTNIHYILVSGVLPWPIGSSIGDLGHRDYK